MKGVIISNVDTDSKSKKKFGLDIFSAFRAGLAGFSAFFTILLAAKYIGSLFGSINSFSVQIEDVFLSFIGFTLLFLIKILENFSKQQKTGI